jgi:hypothetical protein
MTDEEKLAERYVNGIPIFAEEGEGFSRTQMQRAYLAGLKVNVKELCTETLLKELIDRKVIRSWYYNGTYHVGNELPKEE